MIQQKFVREMDSFGRIVLPRDFRNAKPEFLRTYPEDLPQYWKEYSFIPEKFCLSAQRLDRPFGAVFQ